MRRLIDDLLSFSRVSTRPQVLAAVDLDDVLGEVVSDLEARIAQTEGSVEVGPLPTIEADRAQMRQLFQNLIANSLKFHRPGVPPVVTLRADPCPPPPGGLGGDETVNSGWQFTVEDNGIGFEEKYLDRIFQVFQRLHGRNEYEGTGVGLAICRKIVERHGGSITAQSQPGVGTRFIVVLPARQRKREPE
jgi:signal transduction histidine kinase